MTPRIMFAIYKDTLYQGGYRVVYFTELDEHNKEAEINRAMSGEHFYDGFIRADRSERAKQTIAGILDALNEGEPVTMVDVERELQQFMQV